MKPVTQKNRALQKIGTPGVSEDFFKNYKCIFQLKFSLVNKSIGQKEGKSLVIIEKDKFSNVDQKEKYENNLNMRKKNF